MLYIFAEHGLMLEETTAQDIDSISDVFLSNYKVEKIPGWRTRAAQALHIFTRPFSLRASAFFAIRFNEFLYIDSKKLKEVLNRIMPGDRILWFNPSLALRKDIDALRFSQVSVNLYFVDPVSRLGFTDKDIRAWSEWAWIGSYSREEAKRLNINFLVPYAPAVSPVSTPAELDIVYVGSPSPKRLAWVLLLQAWLHATRRKGFVRLATRNRLLTKWVPGIFLERIRFAAYVELCRQSRSVLELHERDAVGVTLRATLCQSLGVLHVCNQPTTPQTLLLSLRNWTFLVSVLSGKTTQPCRPVSLMFDALPFDAWLQVNFSESRIKDRKGC